jgi:hypothetical protein
MYIPRGGGYDAAGGPRARFGARAPYNKPRFAQGGGALSTARPLPLPPAPDGGRGRGALRAPDKQRTCGPHAVHVLYSRPCLQRHQLARALAQQQRAAAGDWVSGCSRPAKAVRWPWPPPPPALPGCLAAAALLQAPSGPAPPTTLAAWHSTTSTACLRPTMSGYVGLGAEGGLQLTRLMMPPMVLRHQLWSSASATPSDEEGPAGCLPASSPSGQHGHPCMHMHLPACLRTAEARPLASPAARAQPVLRPACSRPGRAAPATLLPSDPTEAGALAEQPGGAGARTTMPRDRPTQGAPRRADVGALLHMAGRQAAPRCLPPPRACRRAAGVRRCCYQAVLVHLHSRT